MASGGVEAMLGGVLGGAEGAKVATGALIATVLVLLAVGVYLIFLYLSQKDTMDNDCVCIIDNTVRFPKGKDKDSPEWKKIFPDV